MTTPSGQSQSTATTEPHTQRARRIRREYGKVPVTEPRADSFRDSHSGQPCRSSNQVTVRPPRRRRPHRADRAATSPRPRPPSASWPASCSSGTPGPTRSVTSTRTTSSLTLTATVIVSPGAPDRLCRRLLPKSPRAARRHPRTGAPVRAPPPRTCAPPAPAPPIQRESRSPGPPLQSSVHRLPGRPRPGNHAGTLGRAGECTPDSAAHVKPGNPASAARPWPSVKKPTVHTDRPGGTDARPLYVRGCRDTAPYSDPR